MAETKYFTGDTIRVKVTFRDWALLPAIGSVINPDAVSVTIYASDESIKATIPSGDPKIDHPSVGIYSYDWVLPSEAGKYYIEFKGIYNDVTGAEPCVIRKAVNVKFKLS